jgi:DNA-binding CsgD family transcriptional regulator
MNARQRRPLLADAASQSRGSPLKDLREQLTPREHEVMALATVGLSNKEIGRQLDLSDGTVKIYLFKIFRKVGVANRTALAAMVHRDRYVSQQTTETGGTVLPTRRVSRHLAIIGQIEAICVEAFSIYLETVVDLGLLAA